MPSTTILEQKKQIVADLAAQIKNSAAGVIVNYRGITVENDTAMRRALRKAGVKYVVMKNTLTGRACEEVGYGALTQYLYDRYRHQRKRSYRRRKGIEGLRRKG